MLTDRLVINGTTLDYGGRGDGPPLLLLPGGAGHAGVFDPLASRLADRYRVVAMSSRVASANRPESRTGDQHPKVHAEDTLGLIEALFDTPPIVFGTSSGAITVLELLAHHPGHVRVAVVHEPPLVGLLPDAENQRAALESVRTAARAEGAAAAMPILTAALTATGSDRESPDLRHIGDWFDGYADSKPEPPSPALMEVFQRLGEFQQPFLEHILVPFATHEPDLTGLGAAVTRLVPAAGIDSRGELPYRATAALATRLGKPLTEFPGGHLGPVERPAQFADAIRALLEPHRPS